MIYITGDTHGEQNRFNENNMPGEFSWTKDDYLIVCGDFGYIGSGWMFLDELEKRPYTICFCDGNHENFDRLYQYPEEIWNGGRIHRVRKNIIHLMRGQVYDIDGKTIFAMGGAYSIDKELRIEGRSWWPQELPTDEEYKEASKNLDACGKKVDYIVSHTAPSEIIRRMGSEPRAEDAELTGFLEWVMYEVEFKKWFFGHWHRELEIDGRFRALHFGIEALAE